jgi:prevent-host-death family protein
LKTMTASEVKIKFGEFIKSARKEEVIIIKNGVPLLRVTPIRKSKKELVDDLFDWGVTGLKDEHILDGMLEKYYGR